ncbi:MAG TPA: ABC transporter permease subunit, partial [Bacillota bacterium]
KTGVLNIFIEKLGQDSIMFLGDAALFKHVYVWSGVWQEMGWASIIYIAALTNVDPALYEAASVDGASKFQKMWHIDLPQIMPIAVTLLILGIGNLMSVGFEKAYLMQNNLNLESSEIISTYVYKIGLLGAQFSYSTAVGLFNSIVNCVLLLATNSISRRFTNTSIW